jgi:chromosome segregation ATPase
MSTAACTLLALLGLVAPVARAQTARSGGAPNAQLLQQMQQLASERTSLQAENARLKKDLDDTRKERDALKNAQKWNDARARTSTAAVAAEAAAQRAALEQQITANKAQTEQLIGKFKETLQSLKEVETDRATTKQTLATREQELSACVDRNASLYKLNGEVLDHFEHESAWSRVARAEPFTQIKKVQLENLIDDYKGRAKDQRVTPASGIKPVAPVNSPPPGNSPPAAAGPPPADAPK